jgi:hypothetical protein
VLKKKIIELYAQKIVTKLSKFGFGIRKKPIPDPGIKKAPDPGSATLYITLIFKLN